MGNKKRATCLATLLQNKLNSDVAHFTTHEKNLATLFVARQKKKKSTLSLCISLPLFCTTATWNYLVTRFVEEMSYVFLFDFFSFPAFLPLIFTWVAASISHFFTATTKSFVFSSHEICLLVFYLSLSLFFCYPRQWKFSRKKDSALTAVNSSSYGWRI